MKLKIYDLDDDNKEVEHLDNEAIKVYLDKCLMNCNIGLSWRWEAEVDK